MNRKKLCIATNTKLTSKCHPIHPGIHNNPAIGLGLRAAYDTLMAAMVVAGIVS